MEKFEYYQIIAAVWRYINLVTSRQRVIEMLELDGYFFDDWKIRPRRRETDNFAAIRELWDKWVEILTMFYHPEMYVTVDEHW